MLASIRLAGCCKNRCEEGCELGAVLRQPIENKAIACLGEKNEKPDEIWTIYYDDEKNIFTSASERVCITHFGNIIHGDCKNYFSMLGKGQLNTEETVGTPKTIEYHMERMYIDIDCVAYRRKKNQNIAESTVVSYDKLREPERHRMNRVASCLNSANVSLNKALKNESQ